MARKQSSKMKIEELEEKAYEPKWKLHLSPYTIFLGDALMDRKPVYICSIIQDVALMGASLQ